MTSKQEQLDNISRLKSELKQAQEQFDRDYGNPEVEAKVVKFLEKRSSSIGDITRNVRAFARLSDKSKQVMLNDMISANTITVKTIPTISGRGRPCTKYFLVAADD